MSHDFYDSNATVSPISPQEKNHFFSGHSHSFDIGIAQHLGVNAAIVFNHIIYWLRINKQKSYNFIENKTWMYETISEISKFLGYLSEKQVKTAIRTLVDNGLLIEGFHSKNKFDRTTWYSVPDEEFLDPQKIFTKSPTGPVGNPYRADGKSLQGSCIIQDKHQDKHQENNTNTPPTPKGEVAKATCAFGSFVILKDGEYKTLSEKFGKILLDATIEEMNDYCAASKPKGYTDYAAALRQWMRKRKSSPSQAYMGKTLDRRTKNIDGTPVSSPVDGRF